MPSENPEILLQDVVVTRETLSFLRETSRCQTMCTALQKDFSWAAAHAQLAADRARLPCFKSGLTPSTPNQYRLPDGRTFDAEGDLYGARWLSLPEDTSGGIIPQQFG